MYCPNCAAANSDTTKFCRACGANLSLVPQAMSGQLPEARPTNAGEVPEGEGPPNIAHGIQMAFIGTAFLIIAIVLWFSRMWWGVFMLIPGFAMLGKGVAEIASVKYGQSLTSGPRSVQAPPPSEIPPGNPSLLPPPSVTENTTRQLDPSAKRSKETG